MKGKKLLAVLVTAASMCVPFTAANAMTLEYDNKVVDYTGSVYRLFVNNKEMTELPLSPIIFNDRAVVPVREIFEELGAIVNYTGSTQCVEVEYDKTYVRMYINNNMAYVNGKRTAIPDNVVPKLITKQGGETKTMVPVRFISETIGLDVEFDSKTSAIFVKSQQALDEVRSAKGPWIHAAPEADEPADEAPTATLEPTEAPTEAPSSTPEPTAKPVYTSAPTKAPAAKPEESIDAEDMESIGSTPSPTPTPTPRPAKRTMVGHEDGVTGVTETTSFVMLGADVSHWQGEINWSKAKEDIDFAILNLGYGQDLVSQDDKRFERNARQCEKYGIPYGAYLYSYADSVEKAEGEADHAIRVLKDYSLSFPVYYDLEDASQSALPPEVLGAMAKIFCDKLQQEGYEVGIYANTSWWTKKLTDPVFDDPSWYKWVAQYNTKCTYTGKYTMWQYTSSDHVSGMEGDIDMNYWYGNWRD